MDLVQASGKLQSYTDTIKETLHDIKHEYFYLGSKLWEVKQGKYFEEKGYKSILEYSEKEFNLKKAATYNFIGLFEKFSKKENGIPTTYFDKSFIDFSFSQLCEFLPLNDNEINKNFSPDMTIKQIREKKKDLKVETMSVEEFKIYKGAPEDNAIDVEFKQDQVLLIENQIVIKDPAITGDIDLVKSEPILKKDIVNLIENQTIISDDPVPIVKNNIDTLIEQHKIDIKGMDCRFDKLVDRNLLLIDENKKLTNQLKEKSSDVNVPKENVISDVSDVLTVLIREWSTTASNDFAEGLNKAINIIKQKFNL